MRRKIDPHEVSTMVAAFAKIRGDVTGDDAGDAAARAFVAEYGALGSGITTSAEICAQAATFRHIIALYRRLQLVAAGDAQGIFGLRRAKGGPGPLAKRAALISWAQEQVKERLPAIAYHVEAVPGTEARFRRAAQPRTLLEQIYATAADWIVRGERVDICDNPKCRLPFFVRDERMKYCSPKCRSQGQYLHMKIALEEKRARRKTR